MRKSIRLKPARKLPLLCVPVLVLAMLALTAGSAGAVAAAPGFAISAVAGPSIFSAETAGYLPDDYTLRVTNTGSLPTNGAPITIADALPVGVQVSNLSLTGPSSGGSSCDAVTVSCTYESVLLPGEQIVVDVVVTVVPGTPSPVTNDATVSGGGAVPVSTSATTAIGSLAESLAVPYGLAYLSEQATGPDGLPDGQAGDHPFETTLSFSVNTFSSLFEAGITTGYESQGHATKDVVVDVPPGFVGDPDVVEKCTQYLASTDSCPPASQIGVAHLDLFARYDTPHRGASVPIYNVVPDKGYPAEFVIQFGENPVTLYVEVNPETNYGVRIVTPGLPEVAAIVDVGITFFGTPTTDPDVNNRLVSLTSGATPVAFLDNPTQCSTEPLQTKVSIDSYAHPGAWETEGKIGYGTLGSRSVPLLETANWVSASTTAFPSLEGCELLQFGPSVAVTPETTRADTPTGVNVDLKIPQSPQQFPALVTPALEDSTVTLPAGMSISPSAGDGLQGCSDAQIALLSSQAGSCPDASEVGTAKVTSPLLPDPLEGHVFLGTPNCNPCTNADASDGNMFRLFLEVAGTGVVVKKEGRIYANPSTGQLTTTFKDTPQVPVSDIQLQFKSGLRAALATPQACGAFTTTSDLTPWSSPITPDATPDSVFDVDWDGNGGACPATMPFAPSFSAGTSNPNAGQFSPLTVSIDREDREQDLAGIQVTTPPGLSGILTGVPLCGEPQASLGTCSEASRIGTMTVAAGPGGHPFYEKGSLYVTGPYKGAPFGLSIVVPTVAGPFNLGNVVVRARIDINPVTTALTVTSDPLPQILDGIPLRLRTANVTVDRPGFIFNPTSCAQQHVEATITGAQGAVSHASVPFAVAGCAGLHFGPSFKVQTSGRTSRANGASLDAKVTYPAGAQSNIRSVKVDLPKELPSRLTTLQKACTAQTFEANPAACPAASLIGVARASTPELPVPLTGPAYFVSHGGEAFPSLIIVLQGYGVRIDLTAATFISKAGITSSTFKTVPDAPVNSFELYLPEGPHSALAANGNLCTERLSMPTLFTAQDGARFKQSTRIAVTGCPKAKKKVKAKAGGTRRATKSNRGSRS
jgi:hypothetical protein